MTQHAEACICPRCRTDRYQPDPAAPESSILTDAMGGALIGFAVFTGFAFMRLVGWAVGEIAERVPNFTTGSFVILLTVGAAAGVHWGGRNR